MIVALVGALALAGLPALAAAADDAPVGTVSVTVTDGIGGAPVAGAFLTLTPGLTFASTDANGQHTFTGLADGTYSVYVSDGNRTFQPAGPVDVDVTDAAPDATPTIALTRYPIGLGVITGKLVDSVSGQPIAGSFVLLAGNPIKSTTTDDNGVFTFDGLVPANDNISVGGNGHVYASLTADVNDDTTDFGTIALAPWTSTVSGTVSDSDGNPLPSVSLEIKPVGSQENWAEPRTDAEGHYSTTQFGTASLAAGTYDIVFGGDSTYAAQTVRVVVPANTTVTVDLTLQPWVSGGVSGSVVDAGGAPVEGVCVFALDPTTRENVAGPTITDALGQWSYPELAPGDYIFRLRSCNTDVVYATAYLGGTTPAAATVVSVGVGDQISEPPVAVALGATINGHVDLVSASGIVPLAVDHGASIRLYQSSGGTYVPFDMDDSTSVIGTGGDFSLQGLPAGSYKVEFFDQLIGKRAYQTQYWVSSSSSVAPGAPTLADSGAIGLAAGATRSGINAHLRIVRPTDAPATVSDPDIEAVPSSTLTDTDTVAPGQHLTLSLGAEHAGEWVSVWGHSTPTLLADWVEVSADGTVQVTVPTTFPTGAHRLVAQTADGTVIGWEPFTVSDSVAVTPPAGSSVALPAKALAVSKSTTATSATTGTAAPAAAAAPTPSATAEPSASADSSADASSGSGVKATSPVVSPVSGGLPLWLLVLIVGLGALIVASVIIAIARRARA